MDSGKYKEQFLTLYKRWKHLDINYLKSIVSTGNTTKLIDDIDSKYRNYNNYLNQLTLNVRDENLLIAFKLINEIINNLILKNDSNSNGYINSDEHELLADSHKTLENQWEAVEIIIQKNQIIEVKKELEDLKKQNSFKTSVVDNKKNFDKSAKKNDCESKYWLAGIAIALILLINIIYLCLIFVSNYPVLIILIITNTVI